jgi:TRAP transporter TAXI family solute receptor
MGSWLKWVLIGVVLASISLWLYGRDVIPRPVRIAASNPESQENRLALALATVLDERKHPVQVVNGEGSRDNAEKLRVGEADLAVVQGGALNLQGLEVVAPLYPDAVLFVVRKNRKISRISDLKGKKMLVGLELSGTHELARMILGHYRLTGSVQESKQDFNDLTSDPSLDGALVATALTNPDLVTLMNSGDFEILPIDEAPALATLFPYFHTMNVPVGIFLGDGPIPPKLTQTLALPCLLVGKAESSPRMVTAVLDALYDHRLRPQFPTLYTEAEAANWSLTALLPTSRSYYDPYRGLSTAAAFLSSLSALKELMVASLALFWLAMERYRRSQERVHQAEIREQKQRLGAFINQTIEFESELLAHLREADVLEQLLVRVTQLKVQALQELTHEALRSDQGFAIFLAQCRELVDRIHYNRDRL